ncbi:MAG: VWA domain-containing protein, partial [Prevotella sp.]|nr:VWA domain-containing protein [Prevotella sp.]
MRFAEPIYLYLLIVVVLCVALHYYTDMLRRRRLARYGEKALVRQLAGDMVQWKRQVRFGFTMVALTTVILILARPQMGMHVDTTKRSGIEIMVALDVSNSMLAEDVSPSRMDRCKLLLEKLIDKFDDDKLGLIVFAGDAFVQLPITADYVSARMFLADISPGMITTQGTDIARAIDMASASFSTQPDIGRAIIVITDGEDHEGKAKEAAEAARKKGQNVFVLGVGTTDGAPIPLEGEYMTDENGATVMTRLNEEMCDDVAHAGGGSYINIDNSEVAERRLDEALGKLAKNEFSTSSFNQYDEQFQAFALIAFVLLLIEVFISEKKSRMIGKINFFKGRKMLLLTVLFLTAYSHPASAQTDRDYIRRGNRAYHKKQYDVAEVNYRKALEKNTSNPQAVYNLGNSLLMQGKDSLAVVEYSKALEFEKDKKRLSKIYHNIGVVCQASKIFDKAIEAYKASLRLNPTDNETRYNLALCQKQLKNDKNNENKQNNKDQNKDKNKDKD